MTERGRERQPREVDKRATARILVLVVLVAYAVAFVLMNRDDVEVSFVFFDATVSLIVALLLVGLIGGVAGWLARSQAARRRR